MYSSQSVTIERNAPMNNENKVSCSSLDTVFYKAQRNLRPFVINLESQQSGKVEMKTSSQYSMIRLFEYHAPLIFIQYKYLPCLRKSP